MAKGLDGSVELPVDHRAVDELRLERDDTDVVARDAHADHSEADPVWSCRHPGPGDRVTVVDSDAVRAAALTLFAERGYRATTMADIGAALGIRGPSLYRYLRAKREVLVEIMTNRTGQFAVGSERLASYAILDMGMGVAAWFRCDGQHSVDEIAYLYADFALAMLHVGQPR